MSESAQCFNSSCAVGCCLQVAVPVSKYSRRVYATKHDFSVSMPYYFQPSAIEVNLKHAGRRPGSNFHCQDSNGWMPISPRNTAPKRECEVKNHQ